MIDKERSTKSTEAQELKPVKIVVKDINEINESEEKEYGDRKFTINYPYKIEFADAKEKTISEERTQGTMKAKNWDKKFYENKAGFTSFTSDHALLALCEIKKAITKKDLPAELDLNTFIGFEFDGIVVDYKDGDFIDWTKTLMVNGVEVPGSTVEDKKETKGSGKGAW